MANIEKRPDGVWLRFSTGDVRSVNYIQIKARTVGDHLQAVHSSLYPWWEQLEVAVRRAALFKQECVVEARTGYRFGLPNWPSLANPFSLLVTRSG